MRLVILGGPGAGKGTQAQKLCNHLQIPWISTGDILRNAIATRTELGRQAEPYVQQGELVPDPTMIEFIRHRLLQADTANGWLLDGYPRTAFQAEELDFLLDAIKQHLDWAIWLDLPEPVMMSRSLARGRMDDNPDVVQRRFELFRQRTIPIMEYYEPRNRLLKINANQSPEQVFEELVRKVTSNE